METTIDPEDLVPTIEELKTRIVRYASYLKGPEIRTRQVLVDPLLRSLGWDVERPDLVQLEFDGQHGVPDYALISDDSPVALIEAKKLGRKLEQAKDQLISYALDPKCVGVGLVACTNGDEWVFWGTRRRRKLEPVKISSKDSFKTAYYLTDCLSRANFRKEIDRSAVRSAPAAGDWHPLDAPMPSGTNPPIAIRFGDGTTVAVRYWLDTHIAVARHQLEIGALTRAMVPLQSPRGDRYLIAKSPRHADGKPFRNEKEFADGLWLDGSGGARWTLLECAELVEACGQDPATVWVRFG